MFFIPNEKSNEKSLGKLERNDITADIQPTPADSDSPDIFVPYNILWTNPPNSCCFIILCIVNSLKSLFISL